MSELFFFEVLATNGAEARVRCEVVHPDQHEIPDKPNFALQVVLDAYHVIQKTRLLSCPPSFDRRAASQRVHEHPRKDDLERWLTLADGREIQITEQEYDALAGGPPQAGVVGWSFRDGAYFKSFAPEYAAFRDVAARVVTSVTLVDVADNPRTRFWFDDDGENGPDPRATFVIAVDDPAILAHMIPGLCWPSAIYDFHGE